MVGVRALNRLKIALVRTLQARSETSDISINSSQSFGVEKVHFRSCL
jgi:hypothetical protein